MLALSTATMMLVLGMPGMALPVLFREISLDLGLNLVQIGTIWGFGALTGAVFGLLGGVAGDLRATRSVIGVACIAGGLVGASRGLSNSYTALAVTTLVAGMVTSSIAMNVHKTASQWFSARSFGKANSVLALGFGVGTALGSLVSASVLSPALGGWRHVTFFYGSISVAMGLVWLFSPAAPESRRAQTSDRILRDFRGAFNRVLPLAGFWMIALAGLFYGAANMGFTGYLPLYLTGAGWSPVSADTALSVYNAASIVGVIPLVMLADRRHSTRGLLLWGALVMFAGLLLIPAFPGGSVWPVVIVMGLFREAFMAVTITLTVQTPGIGPRHAGTALGIAFALSGLGRFAAPPLGNALARFGPGYPFLFWAALAATSAVMVLYLKKASVRVRPPEEGTPSEEATRAA
jgi:MFS family permease